MTRVRAERPADRPAVRDVVAAAFARPGPEVPIEVDLLEELRADAGWVPDLSLVAEGEGGSVVGYVVATRGHVGDVPALGLGPLAVGPEHQGRGVGSALVTALLSTAEATGESVVALLGDPGYYGRFGFRAASELGLVAPDPTWGPAFQARALRPDPPRGPFRYAEPFARL